MKKIFFIALLALTLVNCEIQNHNNFMDDFSNNDIEKVENPLAFSIDKDKKIIFSKGNLQYHPKYDIWRFAVNQTDYIGESNKYITTSYKVWIDLFGWGTGAYPTKSTTNMCYYPTFVDWGINKIDGDSLNGWRTLTYEEWNYIIFDRANAPSLRGIAQVNGVNGLILLPDGWNSPADIVFKNGFHSESGSRYYADYQIFTNSQWSALEKAGAVFLPASGGRYASSVYDVRYFGGYWSATEDKNGYARYLYFDSSTAEMYSNNRGYGRSVRLVKDL